LNRFDTALLALDDIPLTENKALIGNSSNKASEVDISYGLKGTATLNTGVFTVTDTNITTTSIVLIGQSTVGHGTPSVPTRYTLSNGSCLFSNADGSNASAAFSYEIIY
jgi:hypothetical protein